MSILYRQQKNILLSLLFSIIITVCNYFINNCPYPYFDTLDKYCWSEYFLRIVSSKEYNDSDAYFLDVGYDKQIADYSLEDGTKGKVAVTDRKKLLSFLKTAQQAYSEGNQYKYIFIDIRFIKETYTEDDSALINQINKMNNIGYSSHLKYTTNDSLKLEKAAINDFFTTITATNVTRYEFLQTVNDSLMESAPIKIYKAINGESSHPIINKGWLYTSNGRLCNNSPFMVINSDFHKTYVGTGCDNYAHLGAHWLSRYPPEVIEATNGDTIALSSKNVGLAIKDKIVIIGDYVNDLHDTYCGAQPGPYLIYLAYKELQDKKHIISWPFILLMIIVYTIIGVFILAKKSLWNYIPFTRRTKNRLLKLLLNFIGYSTLLTLITIIMYLMFHATYNIFIPSVVFSFVRTIKSSY